MLHRTQKLPRCLDRLHQSVDPNSAMGWRQTQRTDSSVADTSGATTSFSAQGSLCSSEMQRIHRRCPEKTLSFKNTTIKGFSQTTDYADQEQLCGCVLSWEANSPSCFCQAWDTQDFGPFSFPKMSKCKISYSQSTVNKTLSNANIKTNLPVSL